MKKPFMCLLMMFLLTGMLWAQEQECPFMYGEYKPESFVTLFGDKVNIRKEASTQAELVTQLSIGSQVSIVEKSEKTYTMGGYTTNWYKVNITGEQANHTGYIWGGLLSMVTTDIPRAEGGSDKLVYGFTSWSKEKDFITTIRIIRDGKVLTSLDFEPISSGFHDAGVFGHGVCIKIDGNHGFKGIKNVIRLEYIYEACGYENGEIFLLWDGVKLTYLAKASMVVEAGIFAYTYDLIFPDMPGGKPNTMQINQEFIETEWNDETEKITNHEITRKKFVWDGLSVSIMPEEVEKMNDE